MHQCPSLGQLPLWMHPFTWVVAQGNGSYQCLLVHTSPVTSRSAAHVTSHLASPLTSRSLPAVSQAASPPATSTLNSTQPMGVKHRASSGAVAVPDVSIPNVMHVERGAGLKKRKAMSTDADTNTESGNRKRTKALPSPSSPPASPSTGGWVLSVPASTPVWATKAVRLLVRDDFGAEWQDLVKTWLQYEDTSGFAASGRLGSKGRPQAVADWIQRACSETFRPTINMSKFSADFWIWWTGLQPAWRFTDRPMLEENQNSGWEGLVGITGTNGLVSVLAALAFWCSGLSADGGQSDALTEWLGAVDDVHQVLQELKK